MTTGLLRWNGASCSNFLMEMEQLLSTMVLPSDIPSEELISCGGNGLSLTLGNSLGRWSCGPIHGHTGNEPLTWCLCSWHLRSQAHLDFSTGDCKIAVTFLSETETVRMSQARTLFFKTHPLQVLLKPPEKMPVSEGHYSFHSYCQGQLGPSKSYHGACCLSLLSFNFL